MMCLFFSKLTHVMLDFFRFLNFPDLKIRDDQSKIEVAKKKEGSNLQIYVETNRLLDELDNKKET